ncbi:MAG TPA: hypothetical protein VKP30_29525 [Polyangiaceae bacterium]|nr:hypothetical protein [Polyangiaceae bacterium]
MNGAGARRKGAQFERDMVLRFRETMPSADVKRGLQYRGGAEVADVDVPCFWPELKRHRRTNFREALRQAIDTCPSGRWPIAICKDDRDPAVVVMQLDDFLDLVREWWERRQ